LTTFSPGSLWKTKGKLFIMSPTSRPKEILKTIDEDEDDIEGLKGR
jgi:hypothetical protein